MCVSAAEHHTAEQYSKTAGQKSESISQEAIYHGTLARTSSRYQVFEQLLWKPSEDASQRSSESNLTPNKTRSSDSFSTVPPIVNGGDRGCIVRDLETIIVLVYEYVIELYNLYEIHPSSEIR